MDLRSKIATSKAPTIYNHTLDEANRDYSQVLPTGTKKVLIKERSGTVIVKLAYGSGVIASTTTPVGYITIPSGSSKYLEGVWLQGKTLYFQCTTTGKIVEIEIWE